MEGYLERICHENTQPMRLLLIEHLLYFLSLEIAFENADVFCQGTTLEVKGSIHLVTFFLVGKHWEETHNYYKNRRHRKQKLKFPQNYSWFSTKCTVVHSQARSGAGDDLPKYSLFLSSSVVDTPLLLPINSFLSKR